MGGILGLCGPDGGPCGGGVEEKEVKMQRMIRNTDSKQALLASEGDSDTTNESLSIESVTSNDTGKGQSMYNVPTKKILIEPIIANHILLHETFIKIRQEMEKNALELKDIDKILYKKDKNCWLIQGKNSISLEDYRDLFDIIIWRVPIIPAFAHFNNEKELYDKLFYKKEPDINIDGIWSILTKEKFIQMFNAKLLTQIDIINDETHSYLADDNKFPSQSQEYKTLINKLSQIEKMKKANEIIIIGQKKCVQDILRAIRQREVNHSSMMSMFKLKPTSLEWEIKCDDPEAPDPKLITSHYCIISNIPLKCTQDQLQSFLSPYSRWTYATYIQSDDETENKNNDNQYSGDDAVGDDGDDEKKEDEPKPTKTPLKYKFGKIEFDNCHSLKTFIDDIQSEEGLYLSGNKIALKRQQKELRNRKRRRLYAGHMIV